MINNYYDAIALLGVKENASQEEIKAAFRSLSKRYHPDLYRGDKGEAFVRINQAYQYLKKHQDPPRVQTVYHQQESYASTNNSRTAYNERQKRTQRNRARQAEKRRQQAESYKNLFRKVKPFVQIVLFLNALLAIDYLMPSIKRTTTIESIEEVYNPWKNGGTEFSCIHFENGGNIYIYDSKSLSTVNQKGIFTYEKTPILRQQLGLYNNSSQIAINIGFNIYKVFGILIIIQILALWFYHTAKHINVKLNALVVMGFFIIIQFVLLMIR